MAKSLPSSLYTINRLLLIGFIFTFPLFFLTTTSNFFETNKLALTIAVAIIALLGWAGTIILKKTFLLTVTPFTFPLLGVAAAVLISTFTAGNNPVTALVGRGSLIPALVIISIIFTTLLAGKKTVRLGLYTLIGSATVLSIISIFQSLGFGLSNLINNLLDSNIPSTLAFTPAGSPIAVLTFLAPILTITLIFAFTKKESLEKVVLFLLSAIMTSGAVLIMLYSFPGKDTAPVFLPLREGYTITLETLKDYRRAALVGVGPESFSIAYNKLRPPTLNLTQFWNIRFTNSSNELFEIITTTGVLGLLAWLSLAGATVKTAKTSGSSIEARVLKIATITAFFLFLLVPATYLHLFTLFTLITLWGIQLKADKEYVKHIDTGLGGISLVRPGQDGNKESELAVLPYIAAAPLLILAAATGFYTYRAYAAEVAFKVALDSAAANLGVETYNAQQEAITQNPYLSRYRRAYSATNLALANAIAGNEDISDEERTQVATLIQQSIREAKAAVTLDPENAANWENLTFIYRSLINVAENADQWTIAALAQAIRTDPVNPRLRLELGGVFYSLGQYDQSIRFYQQAAELKPDWGNAFYNLSAAHKQKKEMVQAYDYLRQVIALVEPNTADYTKAQAELAELASQLKVDEQPQIAPATGELTLPEPAPTGNPESVLPLEDNSGPDADNNLDVIPTPIPPQTNTQE
jgi:tetratricopeptide (TPR) repeat protein